MFVVNGQQINGGYSEAFGLIDVDTIESVAVLRTSSELAPYGIRGANGVIEIITK